MQQPGKAHACSHGDWHTLLLAAYAAAQLAQCDTPAVPCHCRCRCQQWHQNLTLYLPHRMIPMLGPCRQTAKKHPPLLLLLVLLWVAKSLHLHVLAATGLPFWNLVCCPAVSDAAVGCSCSCWVSPPEWLLCGCPTLPGVILRPTRCNICTSLLLPLLIVQQLLWY